MAFLLGLLGAGAVLDKILGDEPPKWMTFIPDTLDEMRRKKETEKASTLADRAKYHHLAEQIKTKYHRL